VPRCGSRGTGGHLSGAARRAPRRSGRSSVVITALRAGRSQVTVASAAAGARRRAQAVGVAARGARRDGGLGRGRRRGAARDPRLRSRPGAGHVVTTLRTPGHEVELAVGWLFSEGLLAPGEIAASTPATRFARPSRRPAHRPPDPPGRPRRRRAPAHGGDRLVRRVRTGLDRRAGAALHARRLRRARPPVVGALAALPDRLREAQAVFAVTGGLHATGLFTPTARW
jgi:FdhD protein